jgi:hypothetical protein
MTAMSESDALEMKACPFCGGENVERHPDAHVMMWCRDCEACGPVVSFDQPKTPEGNWNTRLSSPPPAVGGEVVERLSRVADWHESGGGYRREFEEGHLRIAADLRTVLAALTPQGGQKP